MWKTEKLELGKKYELDEPNHDFWVKVIPLMWMPGETSQGIMQHLQEEEKAVAAVKDDDAAGMAIRLAGMYDILPHMVASWNAMDEDGGLIPIPRVLLESGAITRIKNLPMQLLTEIVNTSISFGQEDEPVVELRADGTPIEDPDAGDNAAKAIPFVNASVSEQPSFLEADLTAQSSNNGD